MNFLMQRNEAKGKVGRRRGGELDGKWKAEEESGRKAGRGKEGKEGGEIREWKGRVRVEGERKSGRGEEEWKGKRRGMRG
ncbi:predicted protein [Sclerotinia sclerotiorum 1980 UF-70]|uniref:Uncharacterized protein n=1 Tax=Sclerotinia sclerotiorum (strain ATCC 18683 / 1980 / Ss-1) TaxID=665079 RepID=A7EE96_SCLS1|nr:predicted protein [Sclerotinia sclerotiorum 1980 UF-70]EDO01162.1 predicted protein [Sclerotinia sclerotiorum 1980 UF-70]